MRSILWHDWLYIYRHRRQLRCLDNILLLTRGKPLSWTHLLSAIRPTDHLYIGVYHPENGAERSIAQIYQSPKMSGAHINYLLHPEEGDPDNLVDLLEGLVKQAGRWGANQLVADLDLNSPHFPVFRAAGFSVLAKQQVFKCQSSQEANHKSVKHWRIWTSGDIPAMRCLYQTLVPPLVQPVEPLTRREMLGLVYYDEKGDLQAYADLVYGPVGIWVLPVIHPQTKVPMTDLLAQMLLALPDRNGRSVYVTARSYQPWVEHALLDLSPQPGPEQALVVRYMALRQRAREAFSFAAFENGKREPTITLAPFTKHHE